MVARWEALVFQSEREPGNPFYQIYTLDLSTGDVKRISPASAKRLVRSSARQRAKFFSLRRTTIPSPNNTKTMSCISRIGQGASLFVDYDPNGIYAYDEKTGATKRLTSAPVTMPKELLADGKWIAFASLRSAYDHS